MKADTQRNPGRNPKPSVTRIIDSDGHVRETDGEIIQYMSSIAIAVAATRCFTSL